VSKLLLLLEVKNCGLLIRDRFIIILDLHVGCGRWKGPKKKQVLKGLGPKKSDANRK